MVPLLLCLGGVFAYLWVEGASSQLLIQVLFFEGFESLLLVELVAVQPFFGKELAAEAEVGLLREELGSLGYLWMEDQILVVELVVLAVDVGLITVYYCMLLR